MYLLVDWGLSRVQVTFQGIFLLQSLEKTYLVGSAYTMSRNLAESFKKFNHMDICSRIHSFKKNQLLISPSSK